MQYKDKLSTFESLRERVNSVVIAFLASCSSRQFGMCEANFFMQCLADAELSVHIASPALVRWLSRLRDVEGLQAKHALQVLVRIEELGLMPKVPREPEVVAVCSVVHAPSSSAVLPEIEAASEAAPMKVVDDLVDHSISFASSCVLPPPDKPLTAHEIIAGMDPNYSSHGSVAMRRALSTTSILAPTTAFAGIQLRDSTRDEERAVQNQLAEAADLERLRVAFGMKAFDKDFFSA